MSGEDRGLFLQTLEQMKNLQVELASFRGEMREFKVSVKDRIEKLEEHKRGGFARVFTALGFCVAALSLLVSILVALSRL